MKRLYDKGGQYHTATYNTSVVLDLQFDFIRLQVFFQLIFDDEVIIL
mgnify:CR=1 FL=1